MRDKKIVSNVVKINISSFVHSDQLLHLFKALLIPSKLFHPLCMKMSQIPLTKSVKAILIQLFSLLLVFTLLFTSVDGNDLTMSPSM